MSELRPIVDIKEWAKRYDIDLEKVECPTCGDKFEFDVPIAIPGYRGVTMSDHGCGLTMPARFVPISKEKIDFWELLRPEF